MKPVSGTTFPLAALLLPEGNWAERGTKEAKKICRALGKLIKQSEDGRSSTRVSVERKLHSVEMYEGLSPKIQSSQGLSCAGAWFQSSTLAKEELVI